MSTVQFHYRLSDGFRAAVFTESGEMPAFTQRLEFDPASMTPEQRATLVAWLGHNLSNKALDQPILDHHPELPEIVTYAAAQIAERTLAERNVALKDYGWSLRQARNSIAQKTWRHIASTAELERFDRYLDTTELRQLIATIENSQLAWQAEVKARREREEQREEAAKARREAEEAAFAAVKLTWANEHGSDHLRRGLAAGCPCDRLYWIERTAHEYPGYMLDYERHAEWKARTCPSVEALDARDAALAAHPHSTAEIVWLTDEPRDRKIEDYEFEPFAECEAVIVSDSSYSRPLVRML